MLALTKKTDYALVALAGLSEQGATARNPVAATRLAELYNLPVHLLIKLLKALQRSGLIGSTRGVKGGYYLAHEPEAINIEQVIIATEGPIKMMTCCRDDEQPAENASENASQPDRAYCESERVCPIRKRVQQVNERVRQFFQTITLRDLLEAEVVMPVYRVGRHSDEEDRPAAASA